MVDDRLAASMERCRLALERANAASRKAEREPISRYTISFDASPSTAERIRSFIAEQATGNRTWRHYALPQEERGRNS